MSGKIEKIEDDKSVVLPTYIAPNDSKFLQDQKEVPKIYDHTKISPDGTQIDFYSLGQQYGDLHPFPHSSWLIRSSVESKEKRYYVRAKRDPQSFYFHADEAPPRYARLSDENHPQCGVENLKNTFTKDMLGKSGEFGSYTTRANVFAREGSSSSKRKSLVRLLPAEKRQIVRSQIPRIQTERQRTGAGCGLGSAGENITGAKTWVAMLIATPPFYEVEEHGNTAVYDSTP